MYPIQINFKLFLAFHADFLWNYLHYKSRATSPLKPSSLLERKLFFWSLNKAIDCRRYKTEHSRNKLYLIKQKKLFLVFSPQAPRPRLLSFSQFFFSTKPKITRNKNQFTRINTNSKTSFSIIGALYAHSQTRRTPLISPSAIVDQENTTPPKNGLSRVK